MKKYGALRMIKTLDIYLKLIVNLCALMVSFKYSDFNFIFIFLSRFNNEFYNCFDLILCNRIILLRNG